MNDEWEDAPASNTGTSSSDGWEDAPKGALSLVSHDGWETASNQSSAETERLQRQNKPYKAGYGTAFKSALAGVGNSADSAISGIAGGLASLYSPDEADKVFSEMEERKKSRNQWANPDNDLITGLPKLAGAVATLPMQIAGSGFAPADVGQQLINNDESLPTALKGAGISAAVNAAGMIAPGALPLTPVLKGVSAGVINAGMQAAGNAGIQAVGQTDVTKEQFQNTPEDVFNNFLIGAAAHGGHAAAEHLSSIRNSKTTTDFQTSLNNLDAAKQKQEIPNIDKAQNEAYRRAQEDGSLEAQRVLNAQDAGGDTSFHDDVLPSVDHSAQKELPFSNDVAHLGDGQQGDLFGNNQPAPRVEGTPEISNNYGKSEQTTGAIKDHLNEQEAREIAADQKRKEIDAAYTQRMASLPEEGRQEARRRANNIRDIQLGQLEQQLRSEAYRPTGDGQGPKTRAFQRANKGRSQRGSAPIINDIAKALMGDREGNQYHVSVQRENFGTNKDMPSVLVQAHDPITGERRGVVDFARRTDGVLTAGNVKVAPAFKGKGVAEMMYKAARSAGHDIAPGQVQTDAGHAMVESFIKKGLINKPADGPRFRAGDLDLTPINGEKIPGDSYMPSGSRSSQRGNAPIINDVATALNKLAKRWTGDDGLSARERLAQKITGQDMVGKGAPWADVRDSIAAEPDGPSLFKWGQSGLQHAADKTGSGLMNFFAKHLNWAEKIGKLTEKEKIQPLEKTFAGLKTNEMIRTMEVMRREMFDRKLYTSAEMRQAGMSDREVNAYAHMREIFTDNLNMQNASRDKMGLEPIQPQTAYLASMWQGNYHLPIRDKEGNLQWYLKVGSKPEADKAIAYLRKNHPDLDLTNPQVKYVATGHTAGDMIGAYQDVLKRLDDNTAVLAAKAALGDALQEKNAINHKHQVHFEDKANIRGFQGDRPWLSPKENAYQQAKAQMAYLKESAHWAPLQEALANIKDALGDKDINEKQPNNVAQSKAYIAKSMGLSTSAFKVAEDYIDHAISANKWSAWAPSLQRFTGDLKKLTYLAQLSFSGGYAIATPLQSLLFGPALHMRLSNQGFKYSFMDALGKTVTAMPLALNKGTWHLLDPVSRDGMKYATANGIVDMNVWDEARDLGHYSDLPVLRQAQQIKKGAVDVANWTISAPEKVARIATFLSFVHHLDGSQQFAGDKQALYQKAEDYTNHTLTDFSKNAKPLAADAVGKVGGLAYVYKSPVVNMWNNLSMLYRDGAKGKGYGGLALALGSIAAMAGPMSLPLINEYDAIMEGAKWMMANSAPGLYAASQKNAVAHAIVSPKETWLSAANYVSSQGQGWKVLGNAMKNGVPSALSGLNLSSRFGGQTADLTDVLSNVAPVGQEVKEQIPAFKGASALLQGNLTNATTQGAQWLHNNMPPMVQGALENQWPSEFQTNPTRANGDRPMQQATDLEANKLSYVRRPAERVPVTEGLVPSLIGESGVRYGGVTSTTEANTKSTRAMINKEQALSKDAQETAMTQMFNTIRKGGSQKDISGLAQAYIANGGDGATFSRDFSAAINQMGMTPEQRAYTQTTSLQAIRKIILINKYMPK